MNEDELFEQLWQERWAKHAKEFDGHITEFTLRSACFDMCVAFSTKLLQADRDNHNNEEQ